MRSFASLDWVLIGAVVILMAMSLLELYSISFAGGSGSTHYMSRQLFFVALACGAMLLFASLDYRLLRSYSRIVYFVTILGLVAVLLVGVEVRGTVGWISLGAFNLQVVEFAKVGLIIFLASFIAAKQTVFSSGGRLIVSFVLSLVIILLVIAQPDFGSAMVLLAIWLGMSFVSGIHKKHLIILIMMVIVGAVGTWFVLEDYQKLRIITFVRPDADPQGSGYNVIQSMVAVGSGGWMGAGLGNGSQTQLRFLPEKHTDFIYAVIAEEMGAMGALFVLILQGVILFRLWRIAHDAPTNFSYLLVSGVMIVIFAHTVVNVGMNIGVMPVTGIPLPFVSYGGNSLLAMGIAVGIALSVQRVTHVRTIAQRVTPLVD
jgi:rod shape determining protein RodA